MPGLDHEMQIDAVARNLVADDGELKRLVGAFAQNGDVDRGSFGPFEQVRDIAGGHVVGGLAIDGDDDVARTDAGAVGGGSDERRDDDDLVVARTDGHTHAVIFAALIFAQQGIGLGIKEIGVRIEHVQHARDGAVVDGLVRIYRLGVVLFHHVVNSGELVQAVADVRVAARSG